MLADVLRADTQKWRQAVDDVLARGRGEELVIGGAAHAHLVRVRLRVRVRVRVRVRG